MEDKDRLRAYMGESIPDGGTDTDTMFTNAEIEDILLNFRVGPDPKRSLYEAAAEGWERKASKYADLVTNAVGGTSRNFSDLLTQAEQRANRFRQLSTGGEGRSARIGKIVRPSTMR